MDTKNTAIFDTPPNRRLIAELTGSGRGIIVVPPPRREDLLAFSDRADAAAFLGRFDWIVLGDWVAADAFVSALGGCGFDVRDLDSVGICAVGESVCDRLRLDQVHADIVPRSADPSAAAAAFDDYAGTESGLRVLIVGSGDPTALREAFGRPGRDVEALAACRLVFEGPTARIRALFEGGAVDEMIVSRPFEVAALNALMPAGAFEATSGTVFRSDDVPTRLALIENGVPASLVRNLGR